jgi:hypothetical protein
MANVDISKQSKTPYLIVTIITVILLIIWGLYLIYANNKNVFPFTPFTPPESSEFFYPRGSDTVALEPLTPEQLALVQQLIAEGITDAKNAIEYNKK